MSDCLRSRHLSSQYRFLSTHTLTNWLESCGGCCTARKLCRDLSRIEVGWLFCGGCGGAIGCWVVLVVDGKGEDRGPMLGGGGCCGSYSTSRIARGDLRLHIKQTAFDWLCTSCCTLRGRLLRVPYSRTSKHKYFMYMLTVYFTCSC